MKSHSPEVIREILLTLLSISTSLAGFCIAGLSLLQVLATSAHISSIADDALGVCSLLFLIDIYLIFWALRSGKDYLVRLLVQYIDAIFLLAITGLVCSGFLVLYAIF
jgi:hypothetical protein